MKNIILIVMDCARPKLISEEATPFLWSLANKGTRYVNHYATSPWTLPSHATMFTGLYTRQHGTEHENIVLPESIPTLAQKLQEEGYYTAAFSNNPWVGPHTGLDRGFEHFEGIWPSRITKLPVGNWIRQKTKKLLMEYSRHLDYRDSGAEKTNDKIYQHFAGLKKWFLGNKDFPYFLFINYMETHHPYKPPEPFRGRFYKKDISIMDLEQDFRKINGKVPDGIVDFEALEMLCQAEMAYLDSKIEELFISLDDGNTVWIITSDHGDLLGEEDGRAGHRFSLHRNLLHVPLIVYYGGKPVTVSYLTQHVDLFKALLNGDIFSSKSYGFAEHTNPLPVLEHYDELKRFGPKFDVQEVSRDLESCFNLAGQLIVSGLDHQWKVGRAVYYAHFSKILEKWRDGHKKIRLENSFGVDKVFDRLRKQGFFG